MKPGTSIEKAIREALSRGYKYDPLLGTVVSPDGRSLKFSLGGTQEYPTVSFYCPTTGHLLSRKNHTFAIPVHLFAAFCLFGEDVFQEGVQVRHLNDVMDIRKGSLALGTRSENMHDVPKSARVRAARSARATQLNESRSIKNRKFTDSDIDVVRRSAMRNPDGSLRSGELQRLAAKWGTTTNTISEILRGRTYTGGAK